MAEPSGTDVDPPALQAHAGQLDAAASGLGTARQAGASVNLDSQAFGILCSFLPPALGILSQRLTDAIGAAGDAASGGASKMRTIASGYHATDQAGARRIGKVDVTTSPVFHGR